METLKYGILAVTAALLLAGCSRGEKSDAYGQFEAVEVTVSAGLPGTLLSFTPEEGALVREGTVAGRVDTTELALQKQEVEAGMQGIRARLQNLDAQEDVLEVKLEEARRERDRVRRMHRDSAATQQQLDRAETAVQVLERERAVLRTQREAVQAELSAMRAKVARLNHNIREGVVRNPVSGRVLTTYVEPSERVGLGQPLYRVADLDTLILKVYVSGGQLPSVALGASVTIIVDRNAEENRTLEGRVSRVADEAEFTPKMIQTKEERVTQVYAVEVRVPNPDGLLKIGMPGEVRF